MDRYERGIYDCSDMSVDCERWFESIGLDTKFVCGDNKQNDRSHMWLRFYIFGLPIDFESTILLPSPFSYYDERYENITFCDGFYKNGTYNETLEWNRNVYIDI